MKRKQTKNMNNMKIKFLTAAVVATSMLAASCGEELRKSNNEGADAQSSEVAKVSKAFELGDSDLVIPMTINKGKSTHYLTDYYPQWVGADNITCDDIRISLNNVSGDWSEFTVNATAKNFITRLDVWHGEAKHTIVVLVGERDTQNSYMSATEVVDEGVLVAATQTVTEAVALWQNTKIDHSMIGGNTIQVAIPEAAADYERSYIRVFASSVDGRFNDVIIPLEFGKVVTSSTELSRHDKHAQTLYSLMIDRFNNGNKANDWKMNSPEVLDKVDYQGGDIAGITAKINDEFFADLGITTIWISPITQNPYDAWGQNVNPDTKFSGYHGYWPIYSTVVDKRFGTDDELREMLSTAHDNGHNVILDYVANHLHINSPVLQEHPDWTTELYLPDGRKNIGQWDGETRLTTWFDEHIPTLDLERPEVCDPMTDSALYWVRNFEFDGFRHDACKHIPLDYWRMLTHKMKSEMPNRQLWQIGETYGDVELIGSYVKSGMIDAQFDFNLYHNTRDVLADESRSMLEIVRTVEESEAAYGSHHTMGNITGNHDKPRFISLAGGDMALGWYDDKAEGWHREVGVGDMYLGHSRLALMKAIITTVPGVPCVYQGDEYGVPGANDPDNRDMMVFKAENDYQQKQYEATAELFNYRRGSMPLMYGNFKTLYADDSVWVFMRHYMDEFVIVAMNIRGDAKEVEVDMPALLKGELKIDVMSDETSALRVGDDTLRLGLSPYSYAIISKVK